MLKKYFLLAIVSIIGILATSAFSSVGFKPVPNNAVSIAETGFRTPPMSNFVPASLAAARVSSVPMYYFYVPSIAATGFRTAPISKLIPSVAAASISSVPMYYFYVPSIAATGFRTPPMSNLIPSIAVSGFRTPSMSNFVPSSIAAARVSSLPMYYFFVPSIAETGFHLSGR